MSFYLHESRLNLQQRAITAEEAEVGGLHTTEEASYVLTADSRLRPAGGDSKMFTTCCQRHHHSLSVRELQYLFFFLFFYSAGSRWEVFDGEGTLFSCRGNVEEVPESLLLSDWQMIQAPRGESCHGSLLDSLLSHLGGIDGQTGRRRSGWRLELWCCLTVCDH